MKFLDCLNIPQVHQGVGLGGDLYPVSVISIHGIHTSDHEQQHKVSRLSSPIGIRADSSSLYHYKHR